MENITLYPTFNVTPPDHTSGNTTDYYEDYGQSPENYFALFVYSLAFVLGTSGNGLVLWFTIFKMKKTVNVIWFLNLSIADFTFTLFLPLSIIYLAYDFEWIFGAFMCKLNSSVAFINLFASVFLLTIISIDCCISVIFPVWCQNHRTPKLALFVVIGVWVLAIIFSLPYFIFRNTVQYYDGSFGCFNDFELDPEIEELSPIGKSRQKGTIITRFLVGFVIPFIVIVSSYSIIALRIQRNHMTTSTKPFKVIIAVIISFFVCWFPYHVISLMELHAGNFSPNVFRIGAPLTSSLAFINSCINPFLYVFIGRDFKKKFWGSFHSIFEKAFNEDSLQKDLQNKTKSTSDSHVV
ncbi:chemokine-like receptor 1 [Bufo gargarizans]|uniref:chemokine-like receptor 1 n=1 Tax=Bufo gargarizans TaxID=30331 RepID=UPI001CF5402E|nr:chemokine-like receptor 1 [Bufo gargarizans]